MRPAEKDLSAREVVPLPAACLFLFKPFWVRKIQSHSFAGNVYGAIVMQGVSWTVAVMNIMLFLCRMSQMSQSVKMSGSQTPSR